MAQKQDTIGAISGGWSAASNQNVIDVPLARERHTLTVEQVQAPAQIQISLPVP